MITKIDKCLLRGNDKLELCNYVVITHLSEQGSVGKGDVLRPLSETQQAGGGSWEFLRVFLRRFSGSSFHLPPVSRKSAPDLSQKIKTLFLVIYVFYSSL